LARAATASIRKARLGRHRLEVDLQHVMGSGVADRRNRFDETAQTARRSSRPFGAIVSTWTTATRRNAVRQRERIVARLESNSVATQRHRSGKKRNAGVAGIDESQVRRCGPCPEQSGGSRPGGRSAQTPCDRSPARSAAASAITAAPRASRRRDLSKIDERAARRHRGAALPMIFHVIFLGADGFNARLHDAASGRAGKTRNLGACATHA